MIKRKDLESFNDQEAKSMKECDFLGNNMEKELLLQKMELKWKESGKMEGGFSG